MPLSLIMRSILAAMLAVVAAAGLAVAQDPPATSREQELMAVLRSETPEAEKALAFDPKDPVARRVIERCGGDS